MSVSKVSEKSFKTKPVCKFFLQNRCAYGAQCRFHHPDINPHGVSGQTKLPPSQAGYVRNRNHFVNGGDTRSVSFQHSGSNTSQSQQHQLYSRYSNPDYRKMAEEAKKKQDEDIIFWRDLNGPFYSIDVECIATGVGYANRFRYPCRVALVEGENNILLDMVVRPKDVNAVVSYLTPLTGMTKDDCIIRGRSLEEVIQRVKELLPSNAILIGQAINHDITWLNLQKGKDFKDSFDISVMFRQALPDKRSINIIKNDSAKKGLDDSEIEALLTPIPIYYRIFSLRHTCIHLLNVDIQDGIHNPVKDAKYSLILFNKYHRAAPSLLRAVRDTLNRAPLTPSFSSLNPVVDGVCMSKIGFLKKHSARFIWSWYLNHSSKSPRH